MEHQWTKILLLYRYTAAVVHRFQSILHWIKQQLLLELVLCANGDGSDGTRSYEGL